MTTICFFTPINTEGGTSRTAFSVHSAFMNATLKMSSDGNVSPNRIYKTNKPYL